MLIGIYNILQPQETECSIQRFEQQPEYVPLLVLRSLQVGRSSTLVQQRWSPSAGG